MSIHQDPATGAIAYLFNGTTLPCRVDADCPGAGYCSIDPESWVSALPSGMCTCYVPSLLVGEACNILTASSIGIIFGYSLVIAIALAIVGFCARLLYLLGCLDFKANALSLTLTFSFLSAVCQAISQLIEVIQFNHASFVIFPDGHKDTSLGVLQNVLLAFFLLFITIAGLQIALLWIRVSAATKKMRRVTENQEKRLQQILAVVYLALLVVCLVTIILGNYVYFVIVALVIVVFVVAAYLYGFVQLRRLLKGALALNNSDVNSHTAQIIHDMRQAMLSIVVCGAITATSLIVYSILGGIKASTPLVSVSNLLTLIADISACFMNLAIVRYAASSVYKARERAQDGRLTPEDTTSGAWKPASAPFARAGTVAVSTPHPAEPVEYSLSPPRPNSKDMDLTLTTGSSLMSKSSPILNHRAVDDL